MSLFWTIWISVITLIVVIGCAILLRLTSKNTTGIPEGEPMPHTFDGIQELNNPLPKWWVGLFWFTIVIAIVYSFAFPTFTANYNGLLNWTSSEQSVMNPDESAEAAKTSQSQYQREMNDADEKFGEVFKQLAYDQSGAYKDIALIAKDPEAVKVGQRLFLQNCAQCHGSDARGSTGFPNLTDDDWLYGGDPASIKETLMNGRNGVMPAWKEVLGGDQGVKEMASYVLKLSGRRVNAIEAQAGEEKFALCAACHGADGKGNYALGAPNLTDKIWLYGGSRKAVEDTLANGRNGVMPAWSKVLGEDKVHLISAFVYSLSLEK
ncbi:cytochrome-c oxidase, cbb3-type subunit III [Psychromonas sp. psych-6C06]|uniref:cytochrome-c oxidase, cbb3-type subunit III n=1 Tax=Psychromonas sp. psych-6C06 TaxID=2058089 RepID=UPI000C32DF25|nr:cytochrome-c oxidase, cbb3-type subunit III [Psychromonas sp. psych-6C06]PKF62572.1 cytochrome-c oxidase, cbb3-type subunit III [Psychromonas sp. psych-6C06]